VIYKGYQDKDVSVFLDVFSAFLNPLFIMFASGQPENLKKR